MSSSIRGAARRRCYGLIALLLLAASVIAAGAAPAWCGSQRLVLPRMKTVSNTYFDPARFRDRNLLIVAGSRESADQSRRWGRAIDTRYRGRINLWASETGEKVLLVPVLDASSRPLSWMPERLLAALVRTLGGDRNVLLDRNGTLRGYARPASANDAALILIGSDATVQAVAVGEYSPANSAQLFRALDSDVASSGPGPQS